MIVFLFSTIVHICERFAGFSRRTWDLTPINSFQGKHLENDIFFLFFDSFVFSSPHKLRMDVVVHNFSISFVAGANHFVILWIETLHFCFFFCMRATWCGDVAFAYYSIHRNSWNVKKKKWIFCFLFSLSDELSMILLAHTKPTIIANLPWSEDGKATKNNNGKDSCNSKPIYLAKYFQVHKFYDW